MPETLPFDIIMNILRMRPRDSQMKSPTAQLMKQEFEQIYNADSESYEVFVPRFFLLLQRLENQMNDFNYDNYIIIKIISKYILPS